MNYPPENFEQLRQYLILLRQGEVQLNVGKKSLTALINMINDPDSVAISNIVELAVKTNISPASITRLAKLLGYRGFNQFQQIFRQRAKIPSDYYSQRAKELVNVNPVVPRNMIRKQLQSTVKNIQQCLDTITDKELVDSIVLLTRTKRIFVFGHKQSSAIANMMRYGLCLIRQNVHFLGQAEHGIAIALGQLRKNDLLVIFSSSPYSNLTINLTALAKKQSCQILAITDSVLSPLNDYATVSINIPTEGQYYTNSLAANCIFIESLLSLTAKELGQSAVSKLYQHEMLLTELDVNS